MSKSRVAVYVSFVFLSALFLFGCRWIPFVRSSNDNSNKMLQVAKEQPLDVKEKVEAKPKREDKKRKPGVVEEVAVLETDKGTIVFKFYPDDAPQTVENFKKLAGERFYDGLTWHRVEPGFVIQGGDPNGDGTGGPGYTIPDEFNARQHLEGTVAMARTEAPQSAGSQFYFCLSARPELDGKYTVFGQTVEGFQVLQNIEKGDLIRSIKIETREVPT